MATVEVNQQYEDWVEENLVKRFESAGVTVTPQAKQTLAYLLQVQMEEQKATKDEVLQRARQLLVPVLRGHAVRYRKQPLTVNRALHLVVDANSFFHFFPSGPTMEQFDLKGGSINEFDFAKYLEKEGQH